MRTIQVKLYQYDELNEKAQERARDWYREASAADTDYADFIIEDAVKRAKELGITLRQRPVELMGGGKRDEPCIYWSGFSSQGDGACFEGSWNAADLNIAKLESECPLDYTDAKGVAHHVKDNEPLHAIADAFATIAKAYPQASFTVRNTGQYSHAYSTTFECDPGEYLEDGTGDEAAWRDAFPESELIAAARDFMNWIYAQLEKEYNYQNADEQVIDTIRANEYEFTAKGKRA